MRGQEGGGGRGGGRYGGGGGGIQFQGGPKLLISFQLFIQIFLLV